MLVKRAIFSSIYLSIIGLILFGLPQIAEAQDKNKKAKKEKKVEKKKGDGKGFLFFGKKKNSEEVPADTLSKAESRAVKKEKRQDRRTARADAQSLRESECAKDPNCRELKKPAKAATMAFVFPGLGQVYNRKYWKLPLVYGLLGTTGYFIDLYHREWVGARNNLTFLTDDNEETVLDLEFQRFEGNVDALRRTRDNARRDRDYSIILFMIFYGLTVADATVDAHLSEFDVSEDLSAKLKPSTQSFFGQPVTGASLVFSFSSKPKPKRFGR